MPYPMAAARGRSTGAAAAGGWWEVAGQTCVAAYQPKGAASLAASYVNLANPGTYDAAPGTAPTFDASTGWTFNGTNQFLKTGIVSADVEWTVLIRFSDVPNNAATVWGNGAFRILPGGSGGGYRFYKYCGGTQVPIVNGQASGVMGVTQTQGWLNGAADASWAAAHSPGVNMLCIGAQGSNAAGSSAESFLPCKVQAFVHYEGTLSAGEIAAVSTLMAAL